MKNIILCLVLHFKKSVFIKNLPKPALDYEKQLEKILNRGCRIENREFALKKLQEIGYYRLSGYFCRSSKAMSVILTKTAAMFPLKK